MGARIQVMHGPDAGRTFVLGSGVARIGRGAGHQVRLTDPAWQDGHVLVELRGGGCVVTNQLPHPIILDGKRLDEDSSRTWFVGGTLQPTGETLLSLETTEDDTDPTNPRAESKTKRRRTGRTWEYAGLIGLVAAWAWLLSTGPDKPNTKMLIDKHDQHYAELTALADRTTIGRTADCQKGTHDFHWAVIYDTQNRRAKAQDRYRSAADLLARAAKVADDQVAANTLTNAADYARKRALGLGQQ